MCTGFYESKCLFVAKKDGKNETIKENDKEEAQQEEPAQVGFYFHFFPSCSIYFTYIHIIHAFIFFVYLFNRLLFSS